jgi:hypothetical protein
MAARCLCKGLDRGQAGCEHHAPRITHCPGGRSWSSAAAYKRVAWLRVSSQQAPCALGGPTTNNNKQKPVGGGITSFGAGSTEHLACDVNCEPTRGWLGI